MISEELLQLIQNGIDSGQACTNIRQFCDSETSVIATKTLDICERNGKHHNGANFVSSLLLEPSEDATTLYCLGQLFLLSYDHDAAEKCFAKCIMLKGKKQLALDSLNIIGRIRSILHHRDTEYPTLSPVICTEHKLAAWNKTKEDRIHLTFDDGPCPVFTPKILDILEKYHQKATFFVVGKKAERHPCIVEQIVSAGHTVYGHSYEHKSVYTALTPQQCIDDIVKTEGVLEAIRGSQKTVFYRFPGGVGHFDPILLETLKAKIQNLEIVHWNAHCADSYITARLEYCKKINLEYIVSTARLLSKITGAGDIILLHDVTPLKLSNSAISMRLNFFDFLLSVLNEEKIRSVSI